MIKLVIGAGAKVPGDQEYSSRSAHITIEAEVADLAGIPAESQRLLALAEDQVAAHLGSAPAQPQGRGQERHQQERPRQDPRPASGYNRPTSNTGYRQSTNRPSGNARGGFKPASAAQLKYLRQLLRNAPQQAEEDIVVEHGVNVIDELSSKAASQVIDRLRNG